MRAANFGFRCIKEIPGLGEAPAEAFRARSRLMALPGFQPTPPSRVQTRSSEVYRCLYGYTRSALAPKVGIPFSAWSVRIRRVEKVS